jgi:hypothetical protein
MRASQNGLKYAFLSAELPLAGENLAELSSLRRRARDTFKPKGMLEEILVQRIVSHIWRLGRIHRLEAAIWTGGPTPRTENEVDPFPLQPFMDTDDSVPF